MIPAKDTLVFYIQGKQPKDVLHDIDLQKCSLEEGNSVQVPNNIAKKSEQAFYLGKT